MFSRAIACSAVTFLSIGFFISTACPSLCAQTEIKEKPKIKDFGKSLKQVKQDLKKNPASEKIVAGESAGGEDVLRVKTTLVVCDVLVTDKQGRPVEGLSRDDFIVTEDGAPQQVETFALGDAASVRRTIVLIIDYSGSQFPFIKTSVAAAKTLIDKLNPNDRMAIVTDDVELVVDFTKDKEKLKKKLDSLESKTRANGFFSVARRFGKSAQYSALMATLNEAFDDEDERPIIIFQTDGDELPLLRDSVIIPEFPPNLPASMREEALKNFARMQQYFRNNMRAFSLNDIYRAAEKSRATVYTVVPGYRLIGLDPDQQARQLKAHRIRSLEAWKVKPETRKIQEENLNRLPPEVLKFQVDQALKVQTALAGVAEITGGWTDFLETPEQASDIYSRILSDINRRYLVGYYPTNSEADGKRRRVMVEVRNHPEYVVWGRKSYLAANH